MLLSTIIFCSCPCIYLGKFLVTVLYYCKLSISTWTRWRVLECFLEHEWCSKANLRMKSSPPPLSATCSPHLPYTNKNISSYLFQLTHLESVFSTMLWLPLQGSVPSLSTMRIKIWWVRKSEALAQRQVREMTGPLIPPSLGSQVGAVGPSKSEHVSVVWLSLKGM